MLLFRSEEHLLRWLGRGRRAGDRLTLDQQWDLARRWFVGRDGPGWKRRTPAEAQLIFESIGLTSSFWNLEGES